MYAQLAGTREAQDRPGGQTGLQIQKAIHFFFFQHMVNG